MFNNKRAFVFCSALIFAAGNGIGAFGSFARLRPPATTQQVVDDVMITGNRRIPESDIQAVISVRKGDAYDPAALGRDVQAIYAQHHFRDAKVYAEDGPDGGKIVTFEVMEWPLVLQIIYEGMNSIDVSQVQRQFRKQHLGLVKESEYDPVTTKRACEIIRELLVERGHRSAKVIVETEDISSTAISLTFIVNEGPKDK